MTDGASAPDVLGYAERRRVADELRRVEQEVARAITDEFIERHPEWLERYGAGAVRRHGEQDAVFHIAFLAAAIEANSVAAFAEYVRWAAAMLRPRGIEPGDLRENLDQMFAAIEEHVPDRAPLLHRYRRAAHDTLAEADAGSSVTDQRDGDDDGSLAASTRRMYLRAILDGRRDAAQNVIATAIDQGLPLRAAYLDVLQRAQEDVGTLWASGKVSVAGEHRATAITEHVMTHLRGRIEPPAGAAPACVVTGVEGERHHVGGRAIADILESAGWEVDFLGSDAPVRAVVEHVAELRPAMVAISVTMPFHLRAAADLVERLRRLDPPPYVVAGGRAFRHTGDLWRELGIDAVGTSIDDVLAAAARARSAVH